MDSSPKNNSPVRLPDELRRELRREAYERGQRTGREPSFGDLLLEAWRAFKGAMAPKGGTTSVDSAEPPKLNSGERQVTVQDDDAPWIDKLLTVRHSQKPGLPTAVENNLNEFVWADLAYDELKRQKSPLVSTQATGASERGAAPAQFARAAGDRMPGTGNSAPPRDLDQAMDEIEAAQREREKGKKVTPRKTG